MNDITDHPDRAAPHSIVAMLMLCIPGALETLGMVTAWFDPHGMGLFTFSTQFLLMPAVAVALGLSIASARRQRTFWLPILANSVPILAFAGGVIYMSFFYRTGHAPL